VPGTPNLRAKQHGTGGPWRCVTALQNGRNSYYFELW